MVEKFENQKGSDKVTRRGFFQRGKELGKKLIGFEKKEKEEADIEKEKLEKEIEDKEKTKEEFEELNQKITRRGFLGFLVGNVIILGGTFLSNLEIIEKIEAKEKKPRDSLENLTEELNDLEAIKKFFEPEKDKKKPIGMNTDILSSRLTISVPTKFNFAPFVVQKIKNLFENKMKWVNFGVLKNLKEERYEITDASVEVKLEEERKILIDAIREIISGKDEIISGKEIKPREVIDKILKRLEFRIGALAILTLEITKFKPTEDNQQTTETTESLILISFGMPHIVKLGLITSILIPKKIDEDLAIKSAIQDAFDNLNKVLNKAFNPKISQSSVFLITSG